MLHVYRLSHSLYGRDLAEPTEDVGAIANGQYVALEVTKVNWIEA